jgi:hypothetical protein
MAGRAPDIRRLQLPMVGRVACIRRLQVLVAGRELETSPREKMKSPRKMKGEGKVTGPRKENE